MKLTFWGAAQTVTGSLHVVEFAGKTVLLDCGLYQGRRKHARRYNEEFPVRPSQVDAVLLSHAHIDHSGLLPKLYKEGFRGPVLATPATRDLCRAMLADSAHIQESDARRVNRREKRKGDDMVLPLYDREDAEAVVDNFVTVGYGERWTGLAGLEVEYRDAGHILGSATMTLKLTENGRTVTLGFTGDVGRGERPILRDPVPMPDCDYLITESTYGGRTHEPVTIAVGRLEKVIRETASRGGKVIIPAFAVGRTQELVYRLDRLTEEGRLPPIPVYVDSPLAINVTEVFRAHPECYDEELLEYKRESGDPFGFERLTYVREASESKKLNASRVPMVVIAASGMCEAGRILHHLEHGIEDPRNTILMVGYCAPHTLGRRIMDEEPKVRIWGQPFRLRAEVEVMSAYSAHADEPELVSFLGQMDRERIKKLFLVHGDPERQGALASALEAEGHRHVHAPERGESFEL